MEHTAVNFNPGFNVFAGTKKSQAATMVLEPNQKTGGPENKHEHSDQWMYVVSGTGVAIVEGQEIELFPGSCILIEAGEIHEIRNTDEVHLETLNFYAPPAY